MDLLVGTSILAAFITGVAALFAPCCITVLLPSYFASIFREKRTVFLMTFIFFLGVLTVYLPLGLGVAALGQFYNRFHNIILSIGSVFLIGLGLLLLTGRNWSLPMIVHPKLRRHTAPSIFLLGILSGIATTCCAPVLAGVLALAALPGSLFWGGVYTVSYVLGMVTPLFVLSASLDAAGFAHKFRRIFRTPLTYAIGKRRVSVAVADAISGIVFIAMGILTISLALMNRLSIHAEYQTQINVTLTRLLQSIQRIVGPIPQIVWVIALVLFLALIAFLAFSSFRHDSHETEE